MPDGDLDVEISLTKNPLLLGDFISISFETEYQLRRANETPNEFVDTHVPVDGSNGCVTITPSLLKTTGLQALARERDSSLFMASKMESFLFGMKVSVHMLVARKGGDN